MEPLWLVTKMNATTFDTIWNSPNFRWEIPEEQDDICIYARSFSADIEHMCRDAISNPSHISTNQAIVIVVKKFMEYRTLVPKSHRNRISEHGHFCIFHAFERAVQTLLLLQMRLAPPIFFEPPPPTPPLPPPQLPQIMGITLGEMIEEEPA